MQCKTLWLARHGVRWEPVPHCFPPYDCPLAPVGQQQAEALAERLAHTRFDFIFCSPFRRTIQTILPLARRLQIPIKLEWGLAEILDPHCLKAFPELPSLAQRVEEFPEIDASHQSLVMPRYPESEEHHRTRVAEVTRALVENYGPTIFLMTHGSPSQAVRKFLLQSDEEFNIDYCGLSRLERNGDDWDYTLAACARHLQKESIHYQGHQTVSIPRDQWKP